MAYRYDADLEFLGKLDDKQLSVLVETLTRDKDGSSRYTETLTGSAEYKKYCDEYSKYWQRIAEEIQTFGGNSFANVFRGGGVLYREILEDVCSKMKIKTEKSFSTEKIEILLLMYLLEQSVEKMNDEERQELVRELDLKTTDFTKQAVLASIQTGLIATGIYASSRMTLILVNLFAQSFGRAMAINIMGGAGTFAASRAISVLAGPIGWAITGAWTAFDIAGPAYRVTIPVCIHIACLRQIHKYSKENNQAE